VAYSARTPTTNLLTQIVNSVAHGFTVGQVLKYTGTWGLAQADSAANATEVGMVSFVPSADIFYITQAGHISALPFAVGDGSSYYLSPAVAGGLTTTKPVGMSEVVVKLFTADSTSSGFFFANAGQEVSSDGLLPWSVVAINTNGATNNGYIATAAITLKLPAASSVGDVFETTVVAGSVQVTQAAGQSIVFAANTTTVGVGGSIASVAVGNSVSMVCITANTKWQVVSSIDAWTLV